MSNKIEKWLVIIIMLSLIHICKHFAQTVQVMINERILPAGVKYIKR